MSGGSFNYLCYRDPDEIIVDGVGDDSPLRRMLRELERYPDSELAVAETRALIEQIRAVYESLTKAKARLDDVFHAVEWHVSCDSGPEVVTDALAKHRALPRDP